MKHKIRWVCLPPKVTQHLREPFINSEGYRDIPYYKVIGKCSYFEFSIDISLECMQDSAVCPASIAIQNITEEIREMLQ